MAVIIISVERESFLHLGICREQMKASFQGGGRSMKEVWPNNSAFDSQGKKDSAGVSTLQCLSSEIIP